jgi:hypothetical protein
VPVSGVPSRGHPTPAAPGEPGDAEAELVAGGEPAKLVAGEAAPGRAGGAEAGSAEHGRALGEQVRQALAGLDEAELAAHPEVFEALSAALVAELRSLEEL